MAIIEIDPYEALKTLALANADIAAEVGTQCDVWHHYGQNVGDWSQTSKSLVFVPTGGELDRENNWSKPTITARCYADTPFECGEVWKALVSFTAEHNERRTVVVTEGKALVEFILPQEGQGMPVLLFDEDARPSGGMPFYSVLIIASINNQTVT